MCWFPLFIFFCYFFLLFFCFGHQFLIFSSTRERLYIYPQRPSGHAVGAGVIPNFMALSLFFFCFGRHSYLSAQLVRGFYPSDLLDKLWSQVPSPHPPPTPPGIYLHSFTSRMQFSIPVARQVWSNPCQLALKHFLH